MSENEHRNVSPEVQRKLDRELEKVEKLEQQLKDALLEWDLPVLDQLEHSSAHAAASDHPKR